MAGVDVAAVVVDFVEAEGADSAGVAVSVRVHPQVGSRGQGDPRDDRPAALDRGEPREEAESAGVTSIAVRRLEALVERVPVEVADREEPDPGQGSNWGRVPRLAERVPDWEVQERACPPDLQGASEELVPERALVNDLRLAEGSGRPLAAAWEVARGRRSAGAWEGDSAPPLCRG